MGEGATRLRNEGQEDRARWGKGSRRRGRVKATETPSVQPQPSRPPCLPPHSSTSHYREQTTFLSPRWVPGAGGKLPASCIINQAWRGGRSPVPGAPARAWVPAGAGAGAGAPLPARDTGWRVPVPTPRPPHQKLGDCSLFQEHHSKRWEPACKAFRPQEKVGRASLILPVPAQRLPCPRFEPSTVTSNGFLSLLKQLCVQSPRV